jgi:tetratricopeptide (TPR) repeat protein
MSSNLHGEALRLMKAGDWSNALIQIERLLGSKPLTPVPWVNRAQCLLALGRRAEAREAAAVARQAAARDPIVLDAVGSVFSFAGDQQRALEAYDRAVALAPDNPQFMFNRATVRRFLGHLDGAEADYDRVIALRPGDFEAYKNRTDLRTQTPARNHVGELEQLIAGGFADWRGEVQIRHALAKELEDIGEFDRSFEQLHQGAKARRAHLRYDVATDVATVDWIIEAFQSAPYPRAEDCCPDAPIFIVGLPRSGTTLVERILSSHSSIESAGELNDFAFALVASVRGQSGGAQPSRRELIERSARVDFAALGRDYLRRARATAARGGRFTDKLPLNYLYCGLIRRALPNARIVHLTRHPLAACYAMYKTLFKDGYPFSYDLGEIAKYYAAYRRLMDFWNSALPGAIHSLSYESLVADQVGETRKLLQYCGLEWQEGCVDFHRNPAATTTASAAQIRRPIYDSSLAQWRHYARQLTALSDELEAAGVPL